MNTLKRITALRSACDKALLIMPTCHPSAFDQRAIQTLLLIERELYLITTELRTTIKETDLVETD